MSVGYYNNLALHISDATLKGHRRLQQPKRRRWRYVAAGVLGAVAICLAAGTLL